MDAEPRPIDAAGRERALDLIARVLDPAEPEVLLGRRIRELEILLGCPHVTDLIFWATPELSPSEVIDRALAYRPFAL